MWWWVTESWIPAAIVFGATAVGLLITAKSTGRGMFAVWAGACLVVAGLAYVIDERVVTPREQVVLRTRSLADAYVHEDRDTFDAHISDDAAFIVKLASQAFDYVDVKDDLRITDVAVELEDDGQRARIHFRANGSVAVAGRGDVGRFPSRWNLDWQREEDEWMLVGVRRLHPIDGTEMGLLSSE